MSSEDTSRFQYEPKKEPTDSTQFKYQSLANRFVYTSTASNITPLKPTGHWLSVCVPIFLDKVENPFK